MNGWTDGQRKKGWTDGQRQKDRITDGEIN